MFRKVPEATKVRCPRIVTCPCSEICSSRPQNERASVESTPNVVARIKNNSTVEGDISRLFCPRARRTAKVNVQPSVLEMAGRSNVTHNPSVLMRSESDSENLWILSMTASGTVFGHSEHEWLYWCKKHVSVV